MKIGETVKVRLQGGKVKKGVITDFVPDLYTHTHTLWLSRSASLKS